MWLTVFAAPAGAATVIYYSAPDNTYGWCAGYGHDRGHSCAKRYCEEAGGTECEIAVECSGGWGAIALAQSPATGFGASCDGSNSFTARAAALTVCATVSRTLCWTDSTFSRNASTASAADDRSFDMTYYAQLMLQIRHYELGNADGKMGPRTRTALADFQTRLGRQATGLLDDELFQRLLDAVGGPYFVAKVLKRDIYDPRADELRDYAYGYASPRAPERTFSEELMDRSREERLTALATVIAASSMECSIPALDAEPLGDASSGFWSIACAEGSFTLVMSEDSTLITRGSSTESKPETEAGPEPEPEPKAHPSAEPRRGHRRR